MSEGVPTTTTEPLIAALTAFLPGPEHADNALILTIRVKPSDVEMATRVVAKAQRDTSRFAMIPHPAQEDEAPEAYFATWAAAIDETYASFQPELNRAREMIDLPDAAHPALPARPSFDRGLAPEAAFAFYVERLAERSQELINEIVLVACADDELPVAVLDALRRFGRLLASRRVRLIILDATANGLFAPGVQPLERVLVGSLISVDGDAIRRFRDFVRSDSARVLVANGASQASQLLATLPEGAAHLARVPYRGRARFENELAAALAGWGRGRAWSAEDRVGPDSVDGLARTLEAHLDTSGLAEVVLAIDVAPSMTPSFLATWAEELAVALASPRTKVVLLEEREQPVSDHLAGPPAHWPRGFSFTSFGFDMKNVNGLLEQAARRPDAERNQRLAGLLGMAGMASGRGEIDKALSLLVEAHPHAQSQEEQAHVALIRGNTHYRAEQFEQAVYAYDAGLALEDVPVGWIVQLTVGLANTGFRLAQYDGAAALYRSAREIVLKLGSEIGGGELAAWEGESFRRGGKREEAASVWSAALQALADDPVFEADIQQLRANLLERLARLRSEQGDAGQANALRQQVGQCGCAPVVLEHP